ncbi:MAG TPA: hypothetical protein VFS58_07115 [Steroidobacteraceae bacterium]|nr:hypothetical protein [Steroidobacteraceae bacterium]
MTQTATIKMFTVASLLLAGAALSSCAREEAAPPPPAKAAPTAYDVLPRLYVAYPDKPDPNCRDGKAKLFDECSDQTALFEKARARAQAEGKTLLVEYGAEWCIWCHVFAAHIKGEHGRFRYTYGSAEAPDERDSTTFVEGKWADAKAALELSMFVAENFVLVHIELEHAPNGAAVLELTGAAEHYNNRVPFIYTVDETGRFVARFRHDPAERRRDGILDWYRGYDRTNMIEQLEAMRGAALANR